jgi:hypothetical protein
MTMRNASFSSFGSFFSFLVIYNADNQDMAVV